MSDDLHLAAIVLIALGVAGPQFAALTAQSPTAGAIVLAIIGIGCAIAWWRYRCWLRSIPSVKEWSDRMLKDQLRAYGIDEETRQWIEQNYGAEAKR